MGSGIEVEIFENRTQNLKIHTYVDRHLKKQRRSKISLKNRTPTHDFTAFFCGFQGGMPYKYVCCLLHTNFPHTFCSLRYRQSSGVMENLQPASLSNTHWAQTRKTGSFFHFKQPRKLAIGNLLCLRRTMKASHFSLLWVLIISICVGNTFSQVQKYYELLDGESK
jgi:hypothetical protein